jgi:hypothetical protein
LLAFIWGAWLSGTGRVPLSKFYGKSITDAEWRFGESESYLRERGALDETSARLGQQVIIPNYIQGASNCHLASFVEPKPNQNCMQQSSTIMFTRLWQRLWGLVLFHSCSNRFDQPLKKAMDKKGRAFTT